MVLCVGVRFFFAGGLGFRVSCCFCVCCLCGCLRVCLSLCTHTTKFCVPVSICQCLAFFVEPSVPCLFAFGHLCCCSRQGHGRCWGVMRVQIEKIEPFICDSPWYCNAELLFGSREAGGGGVQPVGFESTMLLPIAVGTFDYCDVSLTISDCIRCGHTQIWICICIHLALHIAPILVNLELVKMHGSFLVTL